jgi:hypothetical protein
MELRDRLAALARWEPADTPVVSVYLNTRWVDEHQRERVRIFLKQRLREAHDARRAAAADLDWIGAQGRALIDRVAFEDASGVALFACHAGGVREVLPVRVAFEDTFVVDARPFLRPLARAAEETPSALVVFVDGESARLVPLNTTGPEAEVVLETPVTGRHAAGGWAALAQSRYQRHIEAQREQHLQAVAAAISGWSAGDDAGRIVLAGEPRMVTALRRHLPERVAARVVATIAGTRWEAGTALAARAAERLALSAAERESREVDVVLGEAAKAGGAGGASVAGVGAALEAVNREAVRQLYVLASFRETGAACTACAALQRGFHFACAFCGKPTHTVELGEEMVKRVVGAGGVVTTVERHAGLADRGGVAARLRYVEGAAERRRAG